MITIVALCSFPVDLLAANGDGAPQTGGAGARPVKVVSAGSFTVALDADGAVWAWGENQHSQLGTGDTVGRPYPVQVAISGSPAIADIAAGSDYTLALDSQGRVWAWGKAPDLASSNSAVPIPTLVNGLSGIRQIEAGPTSAMALTSDGKVMTWGNSYFGELGQGAQVSENAIPSPVVTDESDTALSGIKQIAKSQFASFAVKEDGTVYQWGSIELPNSLYVASAVSGITGATAVESNPNAGFVYVLTDHGVYSWGQNSRGQLGTGNTANSYTPVEVTSLIGKSVKAISVGSSHALAVMNDGTVWGAGDATRGQLADPRIYWQAASFTKMTTVSDVDSAYAGIANSFFVKRDGTVVASGSNRDYSTGIYGLLGVGYFVEQMNVPAPLIAFAASYDTSPKPLNNVTIQVVNHDQLKFTYDVPALSKFDKILFEVYPQGGNTAILSERADYYTWRGVTGVNYTSSGHLPPGTYTVKIRTENTADSSVSSFAAYDNNAAGYTVHPGSVTLKVLVKEWNATAPANPSVPGSVYGSVFNSPASGVTVTLTPDSDFRNKKTAITSADGVAEFSGVYPGLYEAAIADGQEEEMPRTIAESRMYIYGSQASHTLHIVADTQPNQLTYQADSDTPSGSIGGDLYWYPSAVPSQTTSYRFYFEDGQGNKLGDLLAETPHNPVWTNYYEEVPDTAIPSGAIAIRQYTFDGASERITPNFVTLWNDSMLPLNATMQSTDATGNNLSGVFKWKATASEAGIASYVIMPDLTSINDHNERNKIGIAEIPVTGAAEYNYRLSDFLPLDDYNEPPSANEYMIGVKNALGQLFGYLNSNHEFVPYTAAVEIQPYSTGPENPGGNPGGSTGGQTGIVGSNPQPSATEWNPDGSLTVNPKTTTNSEGRKIAQADIAASRILEALERLPATGDPNQIVLQLPSDGWDDFEIIFEAGLFRKLMDKSPAIVLVVQSKFAALQFPASAVHSAIEPFGAPQTGTYVKLRMSKKSPLNEELLHRLGLSSVTVPIDYKMSFIQKDGSAHLLKPFNAYSQYFLTVPSAFGRVSFSELAGVMVDPVTGKFIPAPAVFAKDSSRNVQARIYGKNNAVYTVVVNRKAFGDTQSSYAKEAIATLSSKYVLNGYADGSFRPANPVTRAEFIAMLTRALGIVSGGNGQSGFTDVKGSDWFAPSIQAAAEAHLISGYSDGSFKPNAEISRMEMLQMIYNAMRSSGMWKNALSEAETGGILTHYTDHAQIPDWAEEAMAAAIKSGITNGLADGRLAPDSPADRAQSASFLYRMLKALQLIN